MTRLATIRWWCWDRRVGALAAAVLLALAFAPPAAAIPSADEVLHEMGFSADAKQKVLAGEFVTVDVKSSSEREIAVAMAFLVKEPPKELIAEARKGLLFQVNPHTIAHGLIQGEGRLDDFKGLKLVSGEKQAKLYLDAKPGGDLNLSKAEIEAFRALKGKPSPQKQVEEQVHRSLLARHQAYRAKGLAGIAPYERKGGKQTSGSGDLRLASEASVHLKEDVPSFYQVLVGYPKAKPSGLEERFYWMSYEAHGTPVFILAHAFSLAEGDAFAICQRQFYSSGNYNVEQALAGFLPVKEGTVVVYVNRTSTDQVTGFGGSGKRSIGRRLMASQLKGLFQDLRKAAEKK